MLFFTSVTLMGHSVISTKDTIFGRRLSDAPLPFETESAIGWDRKKAGEGEAHEA